MANGGVIYIPARSPAAGFGSAVAWLWRLGPVRDRPHAGAVGLGTAQDAGELAELVRAGRLASAVVLAGEPGERVEWVAERRVRQGVAAFGPLRVRGEFVIFEAGDAVVRSTLGVHAIGQPGLLALAVDAGGGWGRLEGHWVLPALRDFLVEALERPLVLLPPVGCLRLDDVPGTAEHQLQGRAKGDSRQRRRIARLTRSLRRAGARLVVAVPARALDAGRPVAIDVVWPRSVDALREGVEGGTLEPANHGLLHLDERALAEGRIEPREFAALDEREAGERLDAATAWLGERMGTPKSFIAPAWGYSAGARRAAAARGITSWLPPRPGPLIEGNELFETLENGLPGLVRLDYGVLALLAWTGLPPTAVFHGGLVDDRLLELRLPRDLPTLARLTIRRDLPRIARLGPIAWVGAEELVARLRAHDAIEIDGTRFRAPPGTEAVLVDRQGRTPARADDTGLLRRIDIVGSALPGSDGATSA